MAPKKSTERQGNEGSLRRLGRKLVPRGDRAVVATSAHSSGRRRSLSRLDLARLGRWPCCGGWFPGVHRGRCMIDVQDIMDPHMALRTWASVRVLEAGESIRQGEE